MSDYSEVGQQLGFEPPEDPATGPRLPGGISIQTAAAALLIVAVVAILWLLAVDPAAAPPDLVTATPADQTPVGFAGTRVGAAPPGSTVAPSTAAPGAATASPVTASAPVTATLATTVAPGAPATGGLAEGGFAQVVGTGPDGIRYRFGPGLNYLTIRIVMDGEVLKVVGGPESGDGLRWWRLQDDQGNIGWAAESYLGATAAPARWNPPAASPTFGAAATDTAP